MDWCTCLSISVRIESLNIPRQWPGEQGFSRGIRTSLSPTPRVGGPRLPDTWQGDDAAGDTSVACCSVLVTVRARTHEQEERRPRPPAGHTDPAEAVSCTCSTASREPGRRWGPQRQHVQTPGAWAGKIPGGAPPDDGPGNADTTSSPAGSAAWSVGAGAWHPVGHSAQG